MISRAGQDTLVPSSGMIETIRQKWNCTWAARKTEVILLERVLSSVLYELSNAAEPLFDEIWRMCP